MTWPSRRTAGGGIKDSDSYKKGTKTNLLRLKWLLWFDTRFEGGKPRGGELGRKNEV